MGSLHGFSLLSLLWTLLVTSLVFSGVFCSSSGAADLCDVSCCSCLPSCDNARLVTCDCPHMDTMTLRKGDIPETVRAVNILKTRHVTIDKDAINGLHSLTNFTLSGIDKLEINQDGMASQNQSKLRSVTFQNVGSLQVERKAFSGVWQPQTSIRMQRIGGLYVKSNAFDYQVTEVGPIVSLQHVEMLNLEPNGFAASLYELDVYNVTMDVCQDGSFGGNTLNTELNNMTVAEARARCFDVQSNSAILSIQSLKMKTVHPQAFSGNMRELIIKDSHLTTIHERGFNIRVAKMQVTDSKINDFRSNGMSVLAKFNIRLEHLRIDDLRRNALAGLRMEGSTTRDQQRLIIKQFDILRAENGSLVLSKSVNLQNLQMNYMNVISRKTLVCPTEKWARMLTGASADGPLSFSQNALYKSLISNNRCEDAPTAGRKVPDSEPPDEYLDDQLHWDDNDNTYDSRRSGVILSTVSTTSTSTDPKSSSVQPHMSQEEAASHESQVPIPTKSWEEVDNGGSHGAGNGNKDIYLTLVIGLGVGLTLAVILAVALLVRRHRSRQPANDQTSLPMLP